MGDFKPLNDRIQKDFYDIMTPDNIWKKVEPDSDLYFVCDATSSYNQIQNTEATMPMVAISLPTDTGTRYFHFKTAGIG